MPFHVFSTVYGAWNRLCHSMSSPLFVVPRVASAILRDFLLLGEPKLFPIPYAIAHLESPPPFHVFSPLFTMPGVASAIPCLSPLFTVPGAASAIPCFAPLFMVPEIASANP